MKFKKAAAMIAMGAVVASMGLVSVACGDKNDPPPTEPKIEYQFTGHYTDDTLKSMGFDYYILLNLFDDGSVKGSGYNQLQMDSSAYADNKAFSEKWYKGSWKAAKNDEDMDYIALNVKYDSDAINSQTGQQLVGDFKYELYADAQGNIKFTVDVPFASGRKQEITGGKTVKFNTLDEFIQGNLYTWTAPENIAIFKSEEPNAVANIYCQANGDALFYSGTKDPAKNEYKYIAAETWKWTQTGGTVTFKKDGDSVGTATVAADNKASFEYSKDFYGHTMTYKFESTDASKLKESSGAQEEEAQPIVTFEGTGATLKVFEDGTAKLSAYGGMVKPSFKWTVEDGKIVFTDAENSTKKYEATVTGDAATVTYADSLGGNPLSIELTCADVSKIVPYAVFTGDNSFELKLYKDHSAKGSASAGGYNLKFDWTWAYADDTITFTDASSTPAKTYTATVSDNAASGTMQLFGSMTVNVTCSDVSKVIA